MEDPQLARSGHAAAAPPIPTLPQYMNEEGAVVAAVERAAAEAELDHARCRNAELEGQAWLGVTRDTRSSPWGSASRWTSSSSSPLRRPHWGRCRRRRHGGGAVLLLRDIPSRRRRGVPGPGAALQVLRRP